MGGIVVKEIYKNMILLEKNIDMNGRLKLVFYLISMLPIILIIKQNYYDGVNDLYSYLVISVLSFCASVLFLDKKIAKYLNFINICICLILYSIVIFFPLLFSVIDIFSNPVYFFVDLFLGLSPYFFIFLFFMFYEKYSMYKRSLY